MVHDSKGNVATKQIIVDSTSMDVLENDDIPVKSDKELDANKTSEKLEGTENDKAILNMIEYAGQAIDFFINQDRQKARFDKANVGGKITTGSTQDKNLVHRRIKQLLVAKEHTSNIVYTEQEMEFLLEKVDEDKLLKNLLKYN